MCTLLTVLLVIAITIQAQMLRFDESNFGQMIGLLYIDAENDAAASSTPRNRILTQEQLPLVHRVIPPGSVVTMDYRKERMNVYLDGNGIVKKVKYG